MLFVVDECAGPSVARFLESLSHFLDNYPHSLQPKDLIVLTEESYRVTKFP